MGPCQSTLPTGAVTLDPNPNPKGGDVFLLSYIGNVLHAQRELLLPSSSAGVKVCGIFRACKFSCYEWCKQEKFACSRGDNHIT